MFESVVFDMSYNYIFNFTFIDGMDYMSVFMAVASYPVLSCMHHLIPLEKLAIHSLWILALDLNHLRLAQIGLLLSFC